MNLGNLIGAMLGIIVGVSLLPVITDTIDTLDTASMPDAAVALIDLLPILFVVIIVAGAVAFLPRFNR